MSDYDEGREMTKRFELPGKIITAWLIEWGSEWLVKCTTTASDPNYSRLLAHYRQRFDTYHSAWLSYQMILSSVQVAKELGAELVIGEAVGQ